MANPTVPPNKPPRPKAAQPEAASGPAPAAAPQHPAFDEETSNLTETIGLAKTEARRLRELKLPKNPTREEQIIYGEWKRYGRQLEAILNRPYFGRIDVTDAEHPNLQPLYIGSTPVYSDETRVHNRVTDWRAPIARLFYEGQVGPQSVKVQDKWVDYELMLVRHLDVEEGALRGVYDQQVHADYPLGAVAPPEGQELVADDYLRSLLKTAAGSHLRDIVRSIQREQHAIIAEDHDHTVIVQGVAGSGKTSIALHRVAQVLYNLRQAGIRRPSALVVAPTPLFLSYISEVLPSLFEEGVPQMTFEDWAGSIVFGTGDKASAGAGTKTAARTVAWPEIRMPSLDRPEDIQRVKFKESLTYRRIIDEGLKRVEETMVPARDLLLSEGTKIDAAQIRGWIQNRSDRPLMVRTERATKLLRTFLKNRGLEKNPEVIPWAARLLDRWQPRQALDVYWDILLDPALGLDRYLGPGQTAPFKAHAQQMKEAGAVEAADLAGLAYLWMRLYSVSDSQRWDHIVVDEGQDFAPLRYAVLAPFARHDSLTIVGDLGQRAREELGLASWEELIGPVFPKATCRLHLLHRSYRTTQKIIQTAHQALVRSGAMVSEPPDSLIPGDPPLLSGSDSHDEMADGVAAWLHQIEAQRFSSTAVITRTVEEADRLWQSLRERGLTPSLVHSPQDRYEGGVVVLPVVLARGLEFDATAVAGADNRNFSPTPENGRLLYIAMTRAKAALAVFWTGTVSPLVAGAEEE